MKLSSSLALGALLSLSAGCNDATQPETPVAPPVVPVVPPAYHIYTFRLDTKGISRLAQGESPVWSPDGSKIAFTDQRGINIVPANGSAGRVSIGNGEGPAWSPDGARIALASNRVE